MRTTKVKRTFEQKFGYTLVSIILAFAGLVTIHVWQDLKGEHDAWIWSCHTMGNHKCGPSEPIIRFGQDRED